MHRRSPISSNMVLISSVDADTKKSSRQIICPQRMVGSSKMKKKTPPERKNTLEIVDLVRLFVVEVLEGVIPRLLSLFTSQLPIVLIHLSLFFTHNIHSQNLAIATTQIIHFAPHEIYFIPNSL